VVRYIIIIYAEYNLGLRTGQDSLEGPTCRFLALGKGIHADNLERDTRGLYMRTKA
jgi:hypothetical protein